MNMHRGLSVRDVASLVMAALQKEGVWAVLVGGGCVTIYSDNQFMSFDLDLISYDPISKVRKALEGIGFVYDKKKYFVHPDSDFFLDFLAPPVSIGQESIQEFATFMAPLGEIRMLTATDCVKDRLAAYFYWGDKQSLMQAICVAKEQDIDLNEIVRWATQEGRDWQLGVFLGVLNA